MKWWANPDLWEDDSRYDRPLEKQVFARIKLQAMIARQDALREELVRRGLMDEIAHVRRHKRTLREMYAERGLTIIDVDGERQVVPMWRAA